MNGKDIIGGVSPLKVVKAKRSGKAAKAATKTGKQRGGYAKVSKTSNRAGYNVNTRFKSRAAWNKTGSGGTTSPKSTSPEPQKPYSYGPGGGIIINNNPTNINENINTLGGVGSTPAPDPSQTTKSEEITNQDMRWIDGSDAEYETQYTDVEGLPDFATSWNSDEFTKKDGKRIDTHGHEYSDDDAGFEAYVKASKEWWASDEGQKLLKERKGGRTSKQVKTKDATPGYFVYSDPVTTTRTTTEKTN